MAFLWSGADGGYNALLDLLPAGNGMGAAGSKPGIRAEPGGFQPGNALGASLGGIVLAAGYSYPSFRS